MLFGKLYCLSSENVNLKYDPFFKLHLVCLHVHVWCKLSQKVSRNIFTIGSIRTTYIFFSFLVPVKNEFVTNISPAVHLKLCMRFCIDNAKWARFCRVILRGLLRMQWHIFARHVDQREKLILLLLRQEMVAYNNHLPEKMQNSV